VIFRDRLDAGERLAAALQHYRDAPATVVLGIPRGGVVVARAIVVAHTVTGDGRIHPRFGGRVFTIDVGMVPSLGGYRAALEIAPDGFWAVYPSGREPLSTSPSPPAAPPSPPTGSGSPPPRP